MVHLKNVARDAETGDPFVTGNAEIRGPDGSTLATPAVNGTTGFWEYQANGQPGVTEQEYSAAGQTKIVSGAAFGQANTICESELERILLLFGDGVIDGMTMAAPGSMQAQVGTGNALNKGVLHPIYTAENVTIDTADAAHPRIDLVVSRLTRTGTFAGRVVLAVVKGTAAASPSAPALTQDADTWEVELARVSVAAGASSIVIGNISTANRSIATGPVADGSVTLDKLAADSVNSSKIVDGSITLADLAAGVIIPGLLPGLQASAWYSSVHVVAALDGSLVIATDTIYAAPIYVPKATTLTGIAAVRSGGSASSATGRLGLYSAGSDGMPDALVHDEVVTIDLSTTGIKQVTGLGTALAAGWYWATLCAGSWSGSLTMSAIGEAEGRMLLGAATPSAATRFIAATGAFVGTGSLPATFPSATAVVNVPLVWIQTSGT